MSQKKPKPDHPATELRKLSHLTHILYVRNKNQHRRSHWWRHLNVFRRQLRALCEEVVPDPPASATKLAIPSPGISLLDARPDVKYATVDFSLEVTGAGQQRIDAWDQIYLSKWYSAFGQILAERRFAALGITLLAVLSRISHIIGLNRFLAELADESSDIPEGHEAMVLTSRALAEIPSTGDDLGEIVERRPSTSQRRDSIDGHGRHAFMEEEREKTLRRAGSADAPEMLGSWTTPQESEDDNSKPKPRKRKNMKKKSNAIDDLFDGL